ncbi:hypothetical protein EN962_23545 [Mesorhizobium sp. M7A.F.Ca.CA.001.09.2.1]|jgi:hypothetical protein|uniref:Uncharacterized protein n=3 Tax=Mesorhizobium TaxID=68287 RepID=E8TI16_MESCW|nr:hypothetical protein Mesci_2122 [Mesorhizobium ciceri biovar biserrulae WSM1271]ARP63874.1 hypothetical protein A9K65_011175 [Mesorhizobium sp. WSM1497]RUU17473.1 hypothetical protein EOC84_24945 [Mesorhizobium sp. Primo-B]RUU40591.1 hypothetical protein EOC83_07640 [Mesorhizobium sp. Primo-A]RUX39946.1 hypothetical protein EN987_09590 [Mesorhizobium sp. M7A.F.Ca.CA.002.11.2.1]RUX47084.1 hypothetical protein EN994_23130 [Mesorhizobium sp. M7A.F.Ca.CA.002.09.1.1]RUX56058.1 hypothetical prot
MLASGYDGVHTGFLRHTPETKFYSSEKLLKNFKGITDLVAVRSSAATLVSGFTDKPMPRLSISLLGALLGFCLVTAAVGQSDAKATLTTRSERCANLSHQFDEALETHATATQVTAAKALQRKGNRYCAAKKQAQGIRMLANALKLLGVTPNDPVQ